MNGIKDLPESALKVRIQETAVVSSAEQKKGWKILKLLGGSKGHRQPDCRKTLEKCSRIRKLKEITEMMEKKDDN